MLRLATAAALATGAALVFTPVASPAGPAEVLTGDGVVLAASSGGSFHYPADGSLVSIASSRVERGRVVLNGIELLNGRVQASRLTVTDRGTGSVDDLVVDGLLRNPEENSLFGLDASSYLVVLQKAVIRDQRGRHVGFVGLRLNLAPGYPGLPRGAQILIGLTGQTTAPAKKSLAAKPTIAGAPWAALGFGGTPQTGAGSPLVSEPLLMSAPLVPATLGGRAVAIAERFLGVPYRWGGADPLTGFDCSGLTMFVYAQLGVSLTHYAAAQFHEGAPVPLPLLEPGDLVFFEPSPLGPGHVGIYIGDGEFIHAPHTGDVVKISSLSGRYATGFVGAVRPY